MCRSCSDALIGVDNDPCLIDADDDPCSSVGVRGSAPTPIISPPRAVSSFFASIEERRVFKATSLRKLPFLRELLSSLLMRLWGVIVEFIRRGRTAHISIQSLPFFSSHLFVAIRMSGKKLITPEDLNMIRDGYNIPSSIVLSAPAAHETPWDNHPGYLCLNKYMIGAGVQIPFDFGVAKGALGLQCPSSLHCPPLLEGHPNDGLVLGAQRLLGRPVLMEKAADSSVFPRLCRILGTKGRKGHRRSSRMHAWMGGKIFLCPTGVGEGYLGRPRVMGGVVA
ncbi:hypothetical protein ACLOJK_023252 [Asimina triloba]